MLLQPVYFLFGEIYKAFGPYHQFFYPSRGTFVGWSLLILVLYLPFLFQFYLSLRMVKTCIRTIHPRYDFKRGDGLVVVQKSLENSIGLQMGVYQAPTDQTPGDASTDESASNLLQRPA